MKKFSILLALALAVALALAGCGKAAESTAESEAASSESSPQVGLPNGEPGSTPLPDDILNQPVTIPEGGPGVDGAMGVDPATGVALEPDAELSGLVDALYEAHPVDLMMLKTNAIDLTSADWAKYNAGLTPELAAKVDAAVLSESMTGSQAYSLVMARVKSADDAQAVADAMMENIDHAKWVCVMADNERVATFGDKVLFVMAAKDLTDVEALVNDAAKAWGVTFDYDVSKDFSAG